MTWARIDDGFTEHRKIIGLSDAEFRLHVAGICYASRQLTDGFIPARALPLLLARATKVLERLADGCVAAGVWERFEDGYLVHDFLDYNPARVDVLDDRDDLSRVRREAGRRGGLASGRARREANPEANGQAKPQQNSEAKTKQKGEANEPPSRPVPTRPLAAAAAGARSREEPAPDPRLGRCIRAYDGLTGQLSATPAVAAKIGEWLDGPNPDELVEWFEAACQEAALHEAKSLKYVLAICERWERDGFQVDGRERNDRERGAAKRPDEFVSGLGDVPIPGVKPFDFGPPPSLATEPAEGTVGDVRPPGDPGLGEGVA